MTSDGDFAPAPAESGGQDLLSPQQRALLDALDSRHEVLAQIYWAACVARNDSASPLHLCVSAYCLRQLMDVMAEYLDLPVPNEPAGVKEMVFNLRTQWSPVAAAIDGGKDPASAVARYVKCSRAFFERFEKANLTRPQIVSIILTGIDPSRGVMPEAVQKLRIEEWGHYVGFFNKILHLSYLECSEEEFLMEMSGLERFLLSYFRPQTFDEYESIRSIVAEAEHRD